MVKEKMYEKIHRLKRQGHSKSQITSKLGIDPKTVAKYYTMDEEEFRAYRREHMFRDKVFEEYEEDILDVYRMNEFQNT